MQLMTSVQPAQSQDRVGHLLSGFRTSKRRALGLTTWHARRRRRTAGAARATKRAHGRHAACVESASHIASARCRAFNIWTTGVATAIPNERKRPSGYRSNATARARACKITRATDTTADRPSATATAAAFDRTPERIATIDLATCPSTAMNFTRHACWACNLLRASASASAIDNARIPHTGARTHAIAVANDAALKTCIGCCVGAAGIHQCRAHTIRRGNHIEIDTATNNQQQAAQHHRKLAHKPWYRV